MSCHECCLSSISSAPRRDFTYFSMFDTPAHEPRMESSNFSKHRYHHSFTQVPIRDHELEYDSDDDIDNFWITRKSEKVGYHIG